MNTVHDRHSVSLGNALLHVTWRFDRAEAKRCSDAIGEVEVVAVFQIRNSSEANDSVVTNLEV